MKGLAFAYDPDGYWIELVKRNEEANMPEPYNLGQTMLRVKDVEKSLDFYTGEGGMGMTKVIVKVRVAKHYHQLRTLRSLLVFPWLSSEADAWNP